MQRFTLISLLFLLFACKDKQIDQEQIIFDRIEFVFNLKQTVGENTWKAFNEKAFEVPLLYFTDSSSYVANPTEKFLATFRSKLVFQNRQIKIYRTYQRVDTLPFHMETGMTLGDSTDDYNYHSPFMKCSSYEEAAKTIPGLLSTEEWGTMIIHEYFHGFQYKHPLYLNYLEESNIPVINRDSLQSFYKNNNWFKTAIDKENDFLLNAISEQDSILRESLIDSLFVLRNERRKIAQQKLNIDIEKYEKCYETMEGTARYVEHSLYNTFSTKRPDRNVLKSDTSFKSFEKFRNYEIKNDKWLYLTSNTGQYFYATGFNMARLLDKLNVEYKSKLFTQGGLSMEDILKGRLPR